ncbi:prepilin-type N-terminal cleavage/methylation domain-containing protein [Patescibacteria group bacterium]|nr:prepilin-type N-terminal cleavage/methylation domain-containing protein [Patescibacteria group bacterium]
MKKNAFTLLEILVVISIIGILVTLGTAAFSTAQKKGRDARRKADIKAMQNGFEQFYSREGAYPTDQGEAGDVIIFPAGLPEDPKNTSPYIYSINLTLSADSYCVCALLESSVGNSSDLPVGVTECTYGTGDYYCLSNLQ